MFLMNFMRGFFLPLSAMPFLFSACAPAAYKVNPPSTEGMEESIQKIQSKIAESEQEGYMRILGDLRWDQLTSTEAWMKRFPKCLTNQWYNSIYIEYSNSFVTSQFPIVPYPDTVTKVTWETCKDFFVGGIPLSPTSVNFVSNSGTKSTMMSNMVRFHFFDDSQRRAVKAALAEKYPYTTDGNCSKFTCWRLDQSEIIAEPTPYTVSLLDQVKIDASDF